jgi:large subunit ribosomal protein L21
VYAIVQNGGHQVKVSPGTTVTVDRMAQADGSEVVFDRVLLVEQDGGAIVAGAPCVANARVIGVVDGEARGPKIRVFKKKRRKTMRHTQGHRSRLTRVRITAIQL